jgi:PAS domain S-box-containing protein
LRSGAEYDKPDRFQLFADSVKDYAFIQFRRHNRVTDWNTGAERVLGYAEDEIVGQDGAIFFTPKTGLRNNRSWSWKPAVTEGRARTSVGTCAKTAPGFVRAA